MAGYKGATFDNDWLKLIFNAVAIANLADNAAASPLTNLFMALHTADPTSGGTQASNECNYTGYARQAVARTTGGFTVTGNSVATAADVTFGAMTAGTNQTATFVSIGTVVSGATKILYAGPLASGIAIANGVAPKVLAGSTVTES